MIAAVCQRGDHFPEVQQGFVDVVCFIEAIVVVETCHEDQIERMVDMRTPVTLPRSLPARSTRVKRE